MSTPEVTANPSVQLPFNDNDIDANNVTLNNIINMYGKDETAAAFSNEFSESIMERLKDEIDNSELSTQEKDEINALIDKSFADGRQAVDPRAEEAVNEKYRDEIDAASEDIISDMSMDALNTSNQQGKGKSWLEALASSLAKIQDKFLSKAMDNLAKMENNAEGATGAGGDSQARSDFLQAQSLFQANMQMFNTTITMSATILKSTGEGLTTMARKTG